METKQNHNEVPALLEIIKKQGQEIIKLQHQLEQLLRDKFGRKSERFVTDPLQAALPFELPPIAEPEKQKENITYTREKKSATSNHKGRLPIPDHLERVDITIAPKEDITGLIKIGEEITEQLEHEPGNYM